MAGILSRQQYMQKLGWSKPQEQEAVPSKGDPESKIHLVSFKPYATLHSSGTPFGAKIEMMLRLAGLPYWAHNGDVQDKKTAPKSKMPVLFHGKNIVPDSSSIVEYLFNTYPSQMAPLAPTDPVSRATADMAGRMLDEHTYFCMLYLNWQRDDAWADFGPIILGDVPAAIRPMIMNMVRGSVLRDLNGQGMGRHSLEEVTAKMAKDLDACEALLQQSGAYLSGATPAAADCMLWGLLDMSLAGDAVYTHGNLPPYVALVKERPGLMAFYGRLKAKVFPNGPSENWTKVNWNPSQDPDAYEAADATPTPPSGTGAS